MTFCMLAPRMKFFAWWLMDGFGEKCFGKKSHRDRYLIAFFNWVRYPFREGDVCHETSKLKHFLKFLWLSDKLGFQKKEFNKLHSVVEVLLRRRDGWTTNIHTSPLLQNASCLPAGVLGLFVCFLLFVPLTQAPVRWLLAIVCALLTRYWLVASSQASIWARQPEIQVRTTNSQQCAQGPSALRGASCSSAPNFE